MQVNSKLEENYLFKKICMRNPPVHIYSYTGRTSNVNPIFFRRYIHRLDEALSSLITKMVMLEMKDQYVQLNSY